MLATLLTLVSVLVTPRTLSAIFISMFPEVNSLSSSFSCCASLLVTSVCDARSYLILARTGENELATTPSSCWKAKALSAAHGREATSVAYRFNSSKGCMTETFLRLVSPGPARISAMRLSTLLPISSSMTLSFKFAAAICACIVFMPSVLTCCFASFSARRRLSSSTCFRFSAISFNFCSRNRRRSSRSSCTSMVPCGREAGGARRP
mmetsp:Transcript_57724/g.167539  ORF Transcript_57724/g.167539 Transcript_57724/m.167539 type:complete len:208 (-) Transcript_57724:75-698(-)